ncbi:hypothetical protein L2E82_02165 [Cichorium intybus]|uniref:Uncharacterized protein n=1 Tax=Cichorium intybus TaxID=13427 RepID=A0ACB9H318_CICIN|nr:hypothetical protein L2E82_02165 [Cichorium intybus]
MNCSLEDGEIRNEEDDVVKLVADPAEDGKASESVSDEASPVEVESEDRQRCTDPMHGEHQPSPVNINHNIGSFVFNSVATKNLDKGNGIVSASRGSNTLGLMFSEDMAHGLVGPSNGPVNFGGRKLPKSFEPIQENEKEFEMEPHIDDTQLKKGAEVGGMDDSAHNSLRCEENFQSIPALDEMGLTVEIGKMIDIEIEVGNAVLVDVMDNQGETIVLQ